MAASVQEQAWRSMLELFLAQRGRLVAAAQEFGLAPLQAIALKHLEPGRTMTMGELATTLHCDNSNVTGIADRLEDRGLVSRVSQAGDRRVKVLELSDEGRRQRAALEEAMLAASPVMSALTADERQALRALLAKAAASAPSPPHCGAPGAGDAQP